MVITTMPAIKVSNSRSLSLGWRIPLFPPAEIFETKYFNF